VSRADLATVLAEERRIMNDWAAGYDTAMISGAYVYTFERQAFARWVAATVRNAGRDPAALAVLDAGCGTGSFVELLAHQGFGNLAGLDIAEGMLNQAKARGLAGARWIEAPIEQSPVEPASFDVVTAVFTIHHLHDPAAFFRLVDTALRPDGWFFALEYDAAARGDDAAGGFGARQGAGKLARALLRRKNRRALAALPQLERQFNPAHRFLSFEDMIAAIERPERYEVVRLPRGVVLPALLDVLVEDSAIDRGLARAAAAVDRRLQPRNGVFQWIAGRRRRELAL
jgi:ubiquinone/menaquinone biosynthesis C-methylase UbiE